uniref:Uncharacterized protein LOC105852882 n=1 Tax=Cicer arietinum TaxID=3827 RepID=A0A1S3EH23_CICAR|nr:uncharacterized protein LOC105852882 [Cicer arietinum]
MDKNEEDEPSSSRVPGPHEEDESDPTSQQPPRGWRTVTHHPLDLIIGNTEDGVRTRNSLRENTTIMAMISQVEPKTIDQAIAAQCCSQLLWIKNQLEDYSLSKKVTQDSTVHVVDSDDSKGNTSAKSIPKSSSKPSTPKRSKTKSTKQSKPTPKKFRSSKTTHVPIFDSTDSETNYTSKWINKSSNEPQYSRLVKAFYAACHDCKGSPGFSFVLKGVHLEVNPTTLCKILDIQDAGARYFAETWYMQYMITRTSVLQTILINPRKPLVVSNLPPMCQIFHNICVHSIVPRAGSFEKVTELDILIIHHLLTGTPLHLSNIIFSYMLNAAIVGRSAPYGMILTKVFKFFKVPLDDEESIQCNNLFSMKNIK